jgi:hypothetical protein
MNRIQQASLAFFAASGVLLLVFLPLTGFPPHLGFLGILSLITAYSLLTKRVWTVWLIGVLLVANSAFGVFTLYSAGFSNVLLALSMIAYVALTWVISIYLFQRRRA